ncbi:hypothetical protein [Cupriavidus sp. amp6]|uniref:hypothetical protein n=1 Tax=Cupriavidus sp. amp6 TaxID=388051 RepID=UPI00041735D1|nr:hypothetical protein [Cupriavidus sp. amp6]
MLKIVPRPYVSADVPEPEDELPESDKLFIRAMTGIQHVGNYLECIELDYLDKSLSATQQVYHQGQLNRAREARGQLLVALSNIKTSYKQKHVIDEDED